MGGILVMRRPINQTRSWVRLLAAVSVAIGAAGCGNMIYAVNANAAQSRLEEAKEIGAERLAPYEYYMAREHLDKAQREAAEADYGDAAELASLSEEYAIQAVKLAKTAREAGR